MVHMVLALLLVSNSHLFIIQKFIQKFILATEFSCLMIA